MEFRQLSYFLEIAQCGSFSKAAVRLSVAQPILSRQIKLLESELGVALLYRNGRGIVLSEVGKLLKAFVSTLQYSYLFGLLPALMLGAVDDIVMHIRRIGPGLRVVIVALIGFASAELLYGSRGPDSGVLQFILYGLVGFVPGAVSSAIAHRFADGPASVASAQPS